MSKKCPWYLNLHNANAPLNPSTMVEFGDRGYLKIQSLINNNIIIYYNLFV
jgi:hypothetical protein